MPRCSSVTPRCRRSTPLRGRHRHRRAAGLVAGEAGVGKTVLLRRFCERTVTAARILWGDCDALFTLSPLGPLADIAAITGGELATLVADGAPPHASPPRCCAS